MKMCRFTLETGTSHQPNTGKLWLWLLSHACSILTPLACSIFLCYGMKSTGEIMNPPAT